MSMLVPLIETLRGGTVENTHFGAVAVCDAHGQLIAHAGDARRIVYTRSTLKPLQALAFVQSGGAQAMGFMPEHVAMLCASHSGEPMHVTLVEQMLAKAGLTVRALQCGCHLPLYVERGIAPAPAEFDERHHNCSGKHAGFLAACVRQGWPIDSYLATDHPQQQAVRHAVAAAVGLAADDLRVGIDGCSAPNYALPLASLARGYARLASGAADDTFGESFSILSQAMVEFPELVSGTGRADLALARAGRGDWIVKGGAEGMQALASRSRGQALAIKIADGDKVAIIAATVEVLDQLGWLDARQREALQPWRAQVLSNLRGTPVGLRRPAFTLRFT